MISTRMIILAPLWALASFAAIITARTIGPDLEEQLFPVITDQSVSDEVRTKDRACWKWSYTKARSVTMIKQTFIVEREDGIRLPVAEFRPDLGIPSNDSTTAKGGTSRTIPKCVFLPDTLQKVPRFMVRGSIQYAPSHHLWTVTQPVIPISFDTMAGPSDNAHDTAQPPSDVP
jgi:hypothetical protein